MMADQVNVSLWRDDREPASREGAEYLWEDVQKQDANEEGDAEEREKDRSLQ